MGPDEHERFATGLEHPFAGPPLVAELDVAFVIDAYCAKGLPITSVRRKRLRLLRRISAIWEPLDDVLRNRRRVKVAMAPGVRPVYAAFGLSSRVGRIAALPLTLPVVLAGPLHESGVLKPILSTHSGKGFGQLGS